MKRILIYTLLCIFSMPALTAERLEMEGTRIRGNQELPSVLYIVPWQQAEVPDLSQPPLQSLIDEALLPVDREVFQRQIRYYDTLSTQGDERNAN